MTIHPKHIEWIEARGLDPALAEKLGLETVLRGGKIQLQRYWEPELYSGPFAKSDDEHVEGVAAAFERSIKRRLISEVPLGAYLSGGLDSSVIVGAMSKIV